MLRLKDNVTLEDLKPYDFHSFKRDGFTTLYRCVPVDGRLIFINVQDKTTPSDLLPHIDRRINFDKWYGDDDRIHKNPKCHWNDKTTAEEVIHLLTEAGLIECEDEQKSEPEDKEKIDAKVKESPVKLGEKIYAVYEGISIICDEVYAIGEKAFLFDPFAGTLENSWEWDFEDEDKTWSKSLDKAKEILWGIVEDNLWDNESLDDLEIVQREEDYWEVRSKKR